MFETLAKVRLNLKPLTSVYLAFHITGQVGLPIIILTSLWSRTIYRHPTLINFLICWIIYSISYCLLLYSGKQYGLVCTVQSVMTHGTPSMSAVAGLCVVIQLWMTLQDPQNVHSTSASRGHRLNLALALPYIVFFVSATISGLLTVLCPDIKPASNGLYCTITSGIYPRLGVPVFCAIIMVILIGFEVTIGIRYFLMWKHISRVFPLAERKTSSSLCIRVALFNLYSVIVLSASIFFISDIESPWPYMVQAALPLVAVLIFGTEKDMFLVWCFWRRKSRLDANSDSFAAARRLSRLSNMELPSSLRLSGALSEHTVV